MVKKSFVVVLSLSLVLALAGCGNDGVEETKKSTKENIQVEHIYTENIQVEHIYAENIYPG